MLSINSYLKEVSYKDFAYKWFVAYPNLLPISYQFKILLAHKWLRVYNFSEEKRYPRNNNDLELVLNKQNEIIMEMSGSKPIVSLIISHSYAPGFPKNYDGLLDISGYKEIKEIPLHLLQPSEFDDELYLCWAWKQVVWQKGTFDALLSEIAQDKLWCSFFVSFENECLICPYDGGMDVFLKDSRTRDYYREKYKNWCH